jgi:gluconokinase
MGVSGSGKTTVARLLAEREGYVFIESDDLHSGDEIAKMASGQPLDDLDRGPWLRRVGERMREVESAGGHSVTACSALKRSYRDLLREYVPRAFFAMLAGPFEVVHQRVVERHHSFMPASLLKSQYEALEPLGPDEFGVCLDLTMAPEDILRHIDAALRDAS